MGLIILLSVGIMALGSQWFIKHAEGRRAGDALRAVEHAQRLYLSNYPNVLPRQLTWPMLRSYVPGAPVAATDLLSPHLSGLGVSVDVTVSPPTLILNGAVYDPSNNGQDGLWDAGN